MVVNTLLLLSLGLVPISGEVVKVEFTPGNHLMLLFTVKTAPFVDKSYYCDTSTEILWETGVSQAPVTIKQALRRLTENKAVVTLELVPDQERRCRRVLFTPVKEK